MVDYDNYFFDISDTAKNDKVFILIIYDISENKRRVQLAKVLQGYGFRIQKSAFEAVISKKKYNELLEKLPAYVGKEDSIRVYKIIGKGQVYNFGRNPEDAQEDVIVI